ncbi:MAG: histidine phosphatase family protein [Acidimicrobiales bacterium]|nr:histidine phosphatase family protein [Acidimicrobiales bacterium]
MSEPREYRQHRFAPPPGAVELLVVRHGESAAAREGELFAVCDGQGDPPLHRNGRDQAERLADRLEHEPLDALYVSTLCRTAQTAAPLAARRNMEPTVLADLREVHLGEWEGGLVRRYAMEGHPIALEIRKQERWDVIPGSESAQDFRARIRRAVTTIAERHADQRVAVVTHGAWIGELLAIASGSRPFAFSGADNASISQVVVLGDRWVVRRFNDTSHLTERFSTAAQPPT